MQTYNSPKNENPIIIYSHPQISPKDQTEKSVFRK